MEARKTLFAWIQLSDIHVGHGDAGHGWDQALVMETLRRDIESAVAGGAPKPDALLVTGDIAFSGGCRARPPDTESREYARASDILASFGRAAGLDAKAIFVVPGNHDVQRDGDRRGSTRRLLRSLRSGEEDLDAALADPEDRALLARRLSKYLAFAERFAPACLGEDASAEERLSWCHRIATQSGLTVRLVGLNTALLAADDQDQGRLRLGKEMLARSLAAPAIAEGELVVVMSHHPLQSGWLADEKDALAWVRGHAHIHLSGHVHEAEAEHSRSGSGGSFVRVAAGAAHGERTAPGIPAGHGYNFASVLADENGKLSLRVHPRRWSDRRKAFTVDIENVPEGLAFSEHELRVRARAAP